MKARVSIERAGPLITVQDGGRFGRLSAGVSASGPMDRRAFERAGRWAGTQGQAGIELTTSGIELRVIEGRTDVGWDGGVFSASVNGMAVLWPGSATLQAGDMLDIRPGSGGNYGYLRFGGEIDVAPQLGSRATNTRAKLGGIHGEPLRRADILTLTGDGEGRVEPLRAEPADEGAIRFVWGIHADRFSGYVRQHFPGASFKVTAALDRMGVRLQDEAGVLQGSAILSLVSDPVLAGDIQILGDGTPIVLMRDHQPTGGYPRIGTIIDVDLDRFAQIRPGTQLVFRPVSVEHAHRLLRRPTP